MTLSVSLSSPAEATLKRRAAAAGKNPAEYARALIEREMLADESFDDILAPIRAAYPQSGMTERQLDQLVSRARKAVSRPRNPPKRGKSRGHRTPPPPRGSA